MQFGLYAPVPHVTVGSKAIEQSVAGNELQRGRTPATTSLAHMASSLIGSLPDPTAR